MNPNPYTEPGQQLPSRARHGQTRPPRRAAAGKARRGPAGPGLGAAPSLRHARARPRPPCTGPGGVGAPQTGPGPGPRREAALLPIPTSTLPRAGRDRDRGRDPARVRRRPRPQPRSGPPAHAAEIPSKAITKPVWGRRRGFVFDYFTGSFTHPSLRNKNTKPFFL